MKSVMLVVLALVGSLLASTASGQSGGMRWDDIAPVPDPVGLGGPLTGMTNGCLVVVGGANFPDAPPWEGGAKVWSDRIFVLEDAAEEWREVEPFSHPIAYGAGVSTAEGLVLLGGDDGASVFDEVWLLVWRAEEGRLERSPMPSLPEPSHHLAATLCGNALVVAPGSSKMDLTDPTHELWWLDLAGAPDERAWRVLPAWPGPPRAKAVAFSQYSGPGAARFFLVSGELTRARPDGELERDYLADAYRYDPPPPDSAANALGSWHVVQPPPRPVAAGSAARLGDAHVGVFSGVVGVPLDIPQSEREVFSPRVLAYHTVTDTWAEAGEMLAGVVTTQAVSRRSDVVVISGEVRPGVRTPRVQRLTLEAGEAHLGTIDLVVIAVYLVGLVAMGFFFSRREKGSEDFFLAGHRIPWWAAGISIYATQLSAITFLSTPALAYSSDWMVWPVLLTILMIAPLVTRCYLPLFRRLGVTTAYEYLERRFGLSVRLFGSASFILYQLARMAIVVYLPALALTTITGIDLSLCILAMGALATIYTVLGGMEAVVWTDVVQTVVLMGGVLLALGLILADAGGLGPILDAASNAGKLRVFNTSTSLSEQATWSLILGGFLLQFGPYTTDQAVLQRSLSTPDERSGARGIWLNGLAAAPLGLLFFLLGTGLWYFYAARPEALEVGMNSDAIFPLFIAQQMPVGVAGLVVAGIFAASMSSLDSSMHAVATSFSSDFVRRFSRAGMDDQRLLRVARTTTAIVGVAGTASALWIASREGLSSMFLFFQSILGLFTSSLVAVFLLAVFTTRANSRGALCGALASTVALFAATFGGSFDVFVRPLIGVGVGVFVGYAVSRTLPGKERDLTGLTWWTRRSRA